MGRFGAKLFPPNHRTIVALRQGEAAIEWEDMLVLVAGINFAICKTYASQAQPLAKCVRPVSPGLKVVLAGFLHIL